MHSEFLATVSELNLPALESIVQDFWKNNDIFRRSLEMSQGKPEYTFYDGPPFATGSPHYGHILAGTIKDIIGRYQTMNGFHVGRRAGWDCHGVPIEMLVNKELQISSKEEVIEYGIANYNQYCRGIVMKCADEWEEVIGRLGRWIDFTNDYKTMGPDYMESVWWVFKTLYQKGLVYRGFKVMPYSTGCTTPLSNFEAGENYKDTTDPSVIVKFRIIDDLGHTEYESFFLAWTTTPWTLPSNLALCTSHNLNLVKVFDMETSEYYILSERMKDILYKDRDISSFQLVERLDGYGIAGMRYEPLFPYFQDKVSLDSFRVLLDEYVKDDTGTGIVHQAPAFGADDFRVCTDNNLVQKDGTGMPNPVNADGNYTDEVSDFAGRYVKGCDKDIIKHLKQQNRMFKVEYFTHSYPFCWRTDTPLIYKAVPGWFINVESIKDQVLANTLQTHWVPDHVKMGRFCNWLENAVDWCVSRTRYWGTPIPIWASDDLEEFVCVGSVDELYQLSGVRVTDLHREHIDHITIPSREGRGDLKRVEGVFDCWFESGSMPYGQAHYPFTAQAEQFEQNFPADFIAEGLDQTRGWFYTLMVLSTALFGKPAFKNVIVNGLVLAEDGKKMSKRLQNYPNPMDIVNQYGADSLRLFLINSQVVRGEPMRFSEQGVRNIYRQLLPWMNAYKFFVEQYNMYHADYETNLVTEDFEPTNIMDKWILSKTGSLIRFFRTEMAAYRLYTIVPRLIEFVDQLTNWYVRMNRDRMKGKMGHTETRASLSTLYNVLFQFCLIMAPFCPFLTETMFRNLRSLDDIECDTESVHLCELPIGTEFVDSPEIEEQMVSFQKVVDMVRQIRNQHNLSVKRPLQQITICSDPETVDKVRSLDSYVKSETNTLNTVYDSLSSYVQKVPLPNMRTVGKKFRGDARTVSELIKHMSPEQMKTAESSGSVQLGQGDRLFEVDLEDVRITHNINTVDQNNVLYELSDGILVLISTEYTDDVRIQFFLRSIKAEIQKQRKEGGLVPSDLIASYYRTENEELIQLIRYNKTELERMLSCTITHEVPEDLPMHSLDIDGQGAVLDLGIELLDMSSED